VKTALVLCIVLAFCGGLAVAQEPAAPATAGPPQYSLGDQTFSPTLGLLVPLFFMSWQPAAYATNLSPGAVLSLQIQPYLTPNIRLGGELALLSAFSPNANWLLEASLTAKISYVISLYPFEIPLSLGAGVNWVKYLSDSALDPLLKPSVSLFWIYNSSWSYGLNFTYWWDMQFSATPSESRVGNFLEISLSALYHY